MIDYIMSYYVLLLGEHSIKQLLAFALFVTPGVWVVLFLILDLHFDYKRTTFWHKKPYTRNLLIGVFSFFLLIAPHIILPILAGYGVVDYIGKVKKELVDKK